MDDAIDVACLCATWCGVCRDYAAVAAQATADFGARVAWRWVDIEDDAALLDDIDVENFPTVLIARGPQVLFYGPITPQPATLARLLQRALAGELAPLAPAPEVEALAGRLFAR